MEGRVEGREGRGGRKGREGREGRQCMEGREGLSGREGMAWGGIGGGIFGMDGDGRDGEMARPSTGKWNFHTNNKNTCKLHFEQSGMRMTLTKYKTKKPNTHKQKRVRASGFADFSASPKKGLRCLPA